MRWVADSFVQTISAPAAAQMLLGGHGRRPPGGPPWRAGLGGDDQVEQEQQGLVVGEHPALVVDEGEVLAAGVDDRPEVGARGADQVGDVAGGGPAVARHDRGGRRVGVHDEDLGPQLGEDVRHHEAGRSRRSSRGRA